MKELDNRTIQELWDFLAQGCNNNENYSIAYQELIEQLGAPNFTNRSYKHYLDKIQSICAEVDLPVLNSIVVNSSTKVPGIGFHPPAGKTVQSCIKEVHSHGQWPLFGSLPK